MNATWRKRALFAGLALVVATNAVVLGGAAYNRYGSPDSSLALTEREVQPAYGGWATTDDSSVSVTLRWRTLTADQNGNVSAAPYAVNAAMATWLDARKLAELGIEAPRMPPPDQAWRMRELLPRDVLVVLELDGDAYAAALQTARARATQAAAEAAARPDSKEAAQNARFETERLANEEKASRLFAVDAGLDRAALRARYPDRERYAIVHGKVRVRWTSHDGRTELNGAVSAIGVDEINVSRHWRTSLSDRATLRSSVAPLPPASMTIAFGRRLEPWIASVAARSP